MGSMVGNKNWFELHVMALVLIKGPARQIIGIKRCSSNEIRLKSTFDAKQLSLVKIVELGLPPFTSTGNGLDI